MRHLAVGVESSGVVTTVEGNHEAEETVRKSRFVARCTRAGKFDDAQRFVTQVSDPKARHNCWAWVGRNTQRSSDDGEPSGTAGRPMLNAIEGQGLVDTVVVVTRYKAKDAPMLGAGGLLRAYGSAASLVLRQADRVDVIPTEPVDLAFPIAELGHVQSLIARFEGRKAGTGALARGSEDYSDTGRVRMVVEIECAFARSFEAELVEVTNGLAQVLSGVPEDE